MILIRRFDETITKASIEKWHKDFQAFTKNVRRIKTYEDFDLVREAAKRWADNFEKYIYNNFLGQNFYNTGFKKKDHSATEEARKKVWALILLIGGHSKELSRQAEFRDFEKQRDNIYQKLARLGREAFESLYGLFYQDDEEFEELYVEDDLEVLGFKVKVIHSEKSSAKDDVKEFESGLKKAKDLIEKKGFKDSLKGLHLILDLQGSETVYSQGASAFYQPGTTEISLLYPSFESLIHEIGHRYYYVCMNDEQRDLWKGFFDNTSMTVIESDVEKFKKILTAGLEKQVEEWKSQLESKDTYPYDVVYGSVEVFKKLYYSLTKDIDNESVKGYSEAALKHLIDKDNNNRILSQIVYNNLSLKKAIDLVFGFVGVNVRNSNCITFTIPRMFVTDYGQTNEKELYAETFRNYMLNKDLPELVLEQFLNISKKR